jgi:hypothetical protein
VGKEIKGLGHGDVCMKGRIKAILCGLRNLRMKSWIACPGDYLNDVEEVTRVIIGLNE